MWARAGRHGRCSLEVWAHRQPDIILVELLAASRGAHVAGRPVLGAAGALVLCHLLFVSWGGGLGGASRGAALGCGSGIDGGEAELALEVVQLGNPD